MKLAGPICTPVILALLSSACGGGGGTGTAADVGPGRKVCRNDSVCPPGQRCLGGFCTTPAGVECTSNTDCDGGVCDLLTNTCGTSAAGDTGPALDAAADTGEFPDVEDADGFDALQGDAGEDGGGTADTGMPVDSGGGFDAGAPGSCTRICDCPQGQYCDLNTSTCALSATRRFYCCEKYGCPAGQTCEHIAGTLGFCEAPGGGCTSACDCPQGYACSAGRCTKGAQPFYCCTKLGCPQNAGCEDAYSQVSMCPDQTGWECTGNCDCMQQHVECTPQHKCIANDQATHCCGLPNCTSGAECVKTDGATLDVCGQCNNDCDCPQGYPCMGNECIMAFQSAYYCCDKPGCPAGESCTTRNDDMGNCPGSAGTCYTDCDCPQGKTCKAGKCDEDITLPSYCCDRANCPEYDACTDKWGNPGHCPKVEL